MQARNDTDNKGTALWPGTAGMAQADDLACQGTSWHDKAWPGLADTRAEGRKPFGLHNQPMPKAPSQLSWHSTAQSTLALVLGSVHERNGTAGMARLARYGWHGVARLLLSAWHGTARHAATLIYLYIYIHIYIYIYIYT